MVHNIPLSVRDNKNKDGQVPWTREQLNDILRSYDKDHNGQLSRNEVKAAFDYLGSRWSYFRTCKAFGSADADNNGLISTSNSEFSDFVNYVLSCGYKVA